MNTGGIYWRWVVANAMGEGVGLGATLALIAGAWGTIDNATLPVGLGLALGVALAGAAVEGTVVGGAQALVIRRAIPAFKPWHWIRATMIGAFAAWALGMLPSTIIASITASGVAASSGGSPADLALTDQLVLAAFMGAALGPFLGVPQWLELKEYVEHAGYWVWANCAAWAVGMPVVFLGMQVVGTGTPMSAVVAVLAVSLLAGGAAVGAIHGVVLVRLLDAANEPRHAPVV